MGRDLAPAFKLLTRNPIVWCYGKRVTVLPDWACGRKKEEKTDSLREEILYPMIPTRYVYATGDFTMRGVQFASFS
jgi:hypothetical protein